MNSGHPKYDLFISYARKDDSQFVQKLQADLTARGFSVWFDKNDIESNGLSFLQSIRDSIASHPLRVLLIVGPHSSVSEYVRFELDFALVNCIVVIPLLLMGRKNAEGEIMDSDEDFNLIPEPVRKRNLHCIDFRRSRPYNEALQELLKSISSPIVPLATLHFVPNKPQNYIDRNGEIEKIKETILADVYKPSIITSNYKTTAVQGMGGIGKSVLASAICHDCDIRRSFGDGIYWIVVGQQNPKAEVTKAIRQITGDYNLNLEENYYQTSEKLKNVLRSRNCLLVLDDVWKQQDIAIFPFDDSLRCRLLVTTRNKQAVANLVGVTVEVDLLDDQQSRSLLSKVVKSDLPLEADDILKECGNLPLAIAMAAGMIMGGDGDKWKIVLRKLQAADLSRIRANFPDYPYNTLFSVLEISVNALEEREKSKYLGLAIFPQDAKIPKEVILSFWVEEGFDEIDGDDLLDDYVSRSLLGRNSNRQYILHDLQFDYIRKMCPSIMEANKLFLTKLGDPLQLTHPYAWNYYIWHLLEAGRRERAVALLQSYEWIESKLAATDINDVLNDYRLFGSDENTELIYGILNRVAHILERDKSQLAGQLVGRLPGGRSTAVDNLIREAKERRKGYWLRPLANVQYSYIYPERTTNLSKDFAANIGSRVEIMPVPGAVYVAILESSIVIWDAKKGKKMHEFPVSGPTISMAFTNDGRRLMHESGYNSKGGIQRHTLQLWDISTGELAVEFTDWKNGRFEQIAVTPDGEFAVSFNIYRWYPGSGSETSQWDLEVDLWNLRSGVRIDSFVFRSDYYVETILIAPNHETFVLRFKASKKIAVFSWLTKRIVFEEIATVENFGMTQTKELFFIFHPKQKVLIWNYNAESQPKFIDLDDDLPISTRYDNKTIFYDPGKSILKIVDESGQVEYYWLRSGPGGVLSRDGRCLVRIASGFLKYWELAEPGNVDAITESYPVPRRPDYIAFNPTSFVCSNRDCTQIVTYTGDNRLLWRVHDFEVVLDQSLSPIEITALTYIESDQYVIYACADGLMLWSLIDGSVTKLADNSANRIFAISVDVERNLVTYGYERSINKLDLESKQLIWEKESHDINSLISISQGGRLVVTAIYYFMKVWNVESDAKVEIRNETTTIRDNPYGTVSFRLLATAKNADRAVTIAGLGSQTSILQGWDLKSGAELLKIESDEMSRVKELAISGDGKLFIAMSTLYRLDCWILDEKRVIASFQVDEPLAACWISDDGITIGAVDYFGRPHIFRLEGLTATGP
jgi:WD40 repeat protein